MIAPKVRFRSREMWWEFYTICYKEMMLKNNRVGNWKSIGLEIRNLSDWKYEINRIAKVCD